MRALGIVRDAEPEEVNSTAKATRRYSARLKFRVVLEALRGEKIPGQIAKAYGAHANSVGLCKQMFLERAPEIFESTGKVAESERRIRELEQPLGRKEVEIAAPKTTPLDFPWEPHYRITSAHGSSFIEQRW